MEPSLRGRDRIISLPYGFWNESFGAAAGYVYAINGYPQPQAGLLGTVMAGTTGSAMGLLMGQNLRPFRSERVFFDFILSVGYFNDVDVYVDGNPAFPNQRAGSNDSDRDDFITGSGLDSFYRLRLKYLLPIGSGRDQVLPAYQLSDGLLASGESGGSAWNPLSSGRTFLELRPFYRTQNIANDDIDEEQSTNGLEFAVFWDNRDYPNNPSRGNALTLKLTRDWGLADSYDLVDQPQCRIRPVHSPRQDRGLSPKRAGAGFLDSLFADLGCAADGRIAHKPPGFLGAHLGGLFRMRAYPSQRFSDKAAVYYAAELRMVPDWNFFDSLPWVQERMGVEWIQFVGFAELGRVAPRYALRDLHRDMRWDVGLGLRAWAKGLVVRVDTAVSDEGFGVQMMVSHPFQF